ncbi:serine/threonine protein kinase [Pseudenhygromyxa sp. WMMC2535]|uniref:serine/threonine-protein kinase n=1 Tax=Pseudenhygromyxa sp. WMMC2535 TaxID=2712867 RepID=UPI001553ABE0|nr:serine/threonine-protein kinase [Pseudenhygromyxa sp. WMMC2535]NVB42905.1 serine/threonine protein kinase [Pseudenhygromyxa sp. WMMC2535]
MVKPLDPGGFPRRFGDYIIHELLDEGGMARIYAAEEALTHRPVAIKILRAEFARTSRGRRQFLNEMSVLATIDDPNVVRCLLCAEIEEQPVMILERLEGLTLRRMLTQRAAIPWREATDYALQIARALRAAHSRHPPVVHRDLKPENVMVLMNGQVKVMDFGISKVLQTVAGSTTHPVGTLQYMSPEHIDAQPIDPRSDLFSLGLVWWEMLAGRPAFHSDSPRKLLDQICNHPAPTLPEPVRRQLSPALQQLLARLLAKDRNQRPNSAQEVIAVLEAQLGGAPSVSVHRHRQPPRAAPNHRERPPSQPRAQSTQQLVDSAAGRSQQASDTEDFAEILSRFGQATSALIVRVLVGLLLSPAAALVYLGVPLLLAVVYASLTLPSSNEELSANDIEEALLSLGLVAIVTTVVFIRSSWHHRREDGPSSIRKPWFVGGSILMLVWLGAPMLEQNAGTTLSAEIHGIIMALGFYWQAFTGAWLMGRATSPLLRRLSLTRH